MSFTLYKTGQRSTSRLDVTDIGRATVMASVLVLLACLVIPAFGILATLVSLELCALAIGLFYRPRCRIECLDCPPLTAGQPVVLRFSVRNVSHWPTYQLTVLLDCDEQLIRQCEPLPYIDRLGPGEEVVVALAVEPRRRGSLHLNRPQCSSVFPFNLFRFNTPRGPLFDTVVLPATFPMTLRLSHPVRISDVGDHQQRYLTGRSPEYIGNRPFVTGDSPTRIDNRAWARLARPAVKQFQQDTLCHLGLVLDNRLPAGRRAARQQSAVFEAAVSLAASTARALVREHPIDLLVIGSEWHTLPAGPAGRCLDIILQRLADATGIADGIGPLLSSEVLHHILPRLSGLIWILPQARPDHTVWFAQARRTGCDQTVLALSDSVPPETPALPAAVDQWHWLAVEDVLAGEVPPL